MKRTTIHISSIFVSSFLTVTALYAQVPTAGDIRGYMDDAYTWGENSGYGTARSIALGSAMTAVGGELGSVSINPAGSAVASYSQISITPGASISMTNTTGIQTLSGDTYMNNNVKSTNGRFICPNGGFTFAFNTGRATGLKRVSFSFVSNTQNFYNSYIQASGQPQSTTSLAGSLASDASHYGWDDYLDLAYRQDIILWHDALPENTYFGITEWPWDDGTVRTDGEIRQNYSSKKIGSKNDFVLNLAMNFSDIVYIGANFGMQNLRYKLDEYYREQATLDSYFTTGFNNLTHTHYYSCSGFGVYGKFGILVTPVGGLRIGAAIQTPTKLNISESYSDSFTNNYDGETFSNSRPVNNVRFRLQTPMRFNVGLAYAFGSTVLLSADYERANYGKSRYIPYYIEDQSWFDDVNRQLDGSMGGDRLTASNIFRAGIEINVLQELPIRLGYNFVNGGTEFYNAYGIASARTSQAVTFGLGYNSPGSFFFDLGGRFEFLPDQILSPYSDYDNRARAQANLKTICAPVIQSRRNLLSIVGTIGWRF